MNDKLQKVAYIGLRNEDGSFLMNMPLYVRIDDLNKQGVSEQQEELIHRISDIMMKRYEKQISEHLAQLKQSKQGEQK